MPTAPSPPEPSRDDDPYGFESRSWVDRIVRPFVRQPMLWPVLVVLVGHAAVLTAPLVLAAVREARPSALLVLAGLGALTALGIRYELRAHRRPGPLTGIALGTWAVTLAGAWVADRYHLF